MKIVTHTLYPVSYINDEGKQIDQLYTFDPQRADKSYWVGEPIEVEAQHTSAMTDSHKIEKIAKLKAEIAKLENNNEA
jgi:hypothetical protein